MEARAAADQVEVPGAPHLLHQGRDVRARVHQVQELAGDLRLLVDLLLHEVRVAALANGVHRIGDELDRPVDEAAVPYGANLGPVGPQCHDLPVQRPDHVPRQRQDGGQVRRDAGEAVADPDDEAGPLLERVQPVVVRAPDHEGVVALQVTVREPDRVDELVAPPDVPLHGMHAGLAVVVRADRHPLGQELDAKLGVVDDVAVVRPDHRAVRVEVRLGVDLRRLAERRPAQLRDPATAPHLREAVARRDGVDLADVLAKVDRDVAEGRHPDGVVAAVGEPLRGLDQDRPEGLIPVGHVAEDAAHSC